MLQFTFPELKTTGNDWYVYFSALHPVTKTMKRKRYRLNHLGGSRAARLRAGRQLQRELTTKLNNGWNPFTEARPDLQMHSMAQALDFCMSYKAADDLRFNTMRTYRQRMQVFREWLDKHGHLDNPASDFMPPAAEQFCDYIKIDRGVGPRTFNNYLNDMKTFFNLLIKKRYVNYNPFVHMSIRQCDTKKREPMNEKQIRRLFEYLRAEEPHFYFLCGYCFFSAIRNTEMTRIQVGDVNTNDGFITVHSENSKTRKIRYAAITSDRFTADLQNYLSQYPKNYYLAGPGFQPVAVRHPKYGQRITEKFNRIAKKLRLPKHATFYSLKDSMGIYLLDKGATVRDLQALFGHTRISTTDKYVVKYQPEIDHRLKKLVDTI